MSTTRAQNVWQSEGEDYLQLVMQGSGPVGGIDSTGKPYGSMGAVVPVTANLYVDGNRTDSYTQNGAPQTPFKTIMGAVNQIITNGDNATVSYTINIAPGTYAETVDLGNSLIRSVSFVGPAAPNLSPLVIIRPSSGNSLQSTANNSHWNTGIFCSISFANPVVISGDTNHSAVGTLNFFDCLFSSSSGDTTFTNVNSTQFFNCSFNGNSLTITNNNNGFMTQCNTGGSSTSFTLVSDSGQNAPSGFIGSYMQMVGCSYIDVAINVNGPTSGTQIDATVGTFLGSTSRTLTIQSGALLRVYSGCSVSSPVTVNSGGELRLIGGAGLRSAVTNSGTYTQQGTVVAANVQAATIQVGNNATATSNPRILSGSGSPNSAVTGSPGDMYLNTAGGSATTLYVKESGASTNTGWVGK